MPGKTVDTVLHVRDFMMLCGYEILLSFEFGVWRVRGLLISGIGH